MRDALALVVASEVLGHDALALLPVCRGPAGRGQRGLRVLEAARKLADRGLRGISERPRYIWRREVCSYFHEHLTASRSALPFLRPPVQEKPHVSPFAILCTPSTQVCGTMLPMRCQLYCCARRCRQVRALAAELGLHPRARSLDAEGDDT